MKDLGDMVEGAVGALKDNLGDYLMLGAGSAGVITLGDLLMSRVLVSRGRPLVPPQLMPVAYAALGVLGGELVRRNVSKDLGVGMIAGGVGLAVSAGVALLLAPTVRATTATAEAAERAGQSSQATAGFGFGRAFAGGLSGFAGIGATGNRELLYGTGQAPAGVAGMFQGANVQIEEMGGPMAGANVQIEEVPSGVGSFLQ